MPAEDEFRKVAEDVRELARALRSELRSAKWEAKEAARQARRDIRAARHWQGWQDPNRTGWSGGWGGSDWSQPGQWWSADQTPGPGQNPGTTWGPTPPGGWTDGVVGDAPGTGATDGTAGGWSAGSGQAGGATGPEAGGPPAGADGPGAAATWSGPGVGGSGAGAGGPGAGAGPSGPAVDGRRDAGNGNGAGGPAASGSGGAGPRASGPSVGGRNWAGAGGPVGGGPRPPGPPNGAGRSRAPGPVPGGGWTAPTGYARPGYNPGAAAGQPGPPWSPQWGPGGRPPWGRSRYRGPNGYGPPPAWSTGPAPGPAVGTQLAPPPWPPTPARAARPPKPPKPSRKDLPPIRHRRDGSTLLSLLLVLVGLAWLVSTTGVLDVSLEAVVAAALVILGAAMVVTARTDWGLSRRSWPVWVGAILIVLLASSVNGRSIGARLSSLRFGPVNTTPVNWADANTTVSGFAGPVAVDLTELNPGTATGTETMHVRNTFGPITVTLPANPKFKVHIDARTSFGPVAVPGASGRGSGGVFTHEVADVGNGAATLNLNLSDGFGPVAINTLGGNVNSLLLPPTPTVPPAPGAPQSHEG